MKVLPINPATSDSPEALGEFFLQCQAFARQAGHPQLVSISLPVEALDPLAVLESIFETGERHFYLEKPSDGVAIAAAEAALSFEYDGADRCEAVQRFVDETLAHCICVGDLSRAFAGPHFFVALSFASETEAGEPFRSATVFVPRWQVAQTQGTTVAVANAVIGPDDDLRPLLERIWRARQKFAAFGHSAVNREEPVEAPLSIAWTPVGAEGAYEAAVAEAVKRIQRGDFAKIVLARAKDACADRPLHPLRILNELRERYVDCFSFSLANGRGQSFIGATPERLVRVRGAEMETEALAGSTRRGLTASEDAQLGSALLRSDKDRGEQQIVLDSICRRVRPLGVEPHFEATPRLRKLANVQHLLTPVRASLPMGVRLLDLVRVLHPTPAVGGTPREAAVKCIRSLEQCPRGLYAGAIGWLNSQGEGDFVVGLRSALIDGARARLYAGAGIVAGSEPARERAETDLKFKAMEQALLGRG